MDMASKIRSRINPNIFTTLNVKSFMSIKLTFTYQLN